MPSENNWSVNPTMVAVADDAGVLPTIKNLASGSRRLCGEIDNTTTLDQLAKVVVRVEGASAFTAGGAVDLYLMESSDGTIYERGDDTNAPTKSPYWTWEVAASTDSQDLIAHIPIPPAKYKLLIVNRTGQTFKNTNDLNFVKVGHYNEEAQ